MRREEIIEEVFKVDFWGARGEGPARTTATNIVDRLIHKGVLKVDPEGGSDDRPSALYTGGITAGLHDECLVTIWPDGDCEVAFRSGLSAWGPPESLTEVSTR